MILRAKDAPANEGTFEVPDEDQAQAMLATGEYEKVADPAAEESDG